MDFTKFDLSEKCQSVECHIIVLRYGPALAKVMIPFVGETEAIGGLYRAYINIFGKSRSVKHDPDFVFLSWKKVIVRFGILFQNCESIFIFCDGGPHHYKSRHGFFALAHLTAEFQKVRFSFFL